MLLSVVWFWSLKLFQRFLMPKAFQGLGFISGTNAERLAHTVGVAEAGTQWFETDTSAIYVWSGSAWFRSIYSGLTPAGGSLTGTYPNPSLAANEAWRVVGAAGQPAFQNSWVNYASGYTGARFKKDKENTVFVEGLVKNGSGTIFTLPSGYRSTGGALIIPTVTNSNAIGRIDLASGGEVIFSSGNNAWFSICFSFKAE